MENRGSGVPGSHVNHLLGALPGKEWQAISPHLELIRMLPGQLVSDVGQCIHHIYFPTTAVVSMLVQLEDGASMEVAMIGHEGLIGIPVLTGGGSMPYRVEVRSAGLGYQLPADTFRQAFIQSAAIRRVSLLYLHAVLTHVAQTAFCIRHHSVTEQLCRWLLLATDRRRANALAITQQSIAERLGVRREGVTAAVGRLAELGLIQHSRGRIAVLDRGGLELCACGCYRLVRHEYERLFPAATPEPARAEESEARSRPAASLHPGSCL